MDNHISIKYQSRCLHKNLCLTIIIIVIITIHDSLLAEAFTTPIPTRSIPQNSHRFDDEMQPSSTRVSLISPKDNVLYKYPNRRRQQQYLPTTTSLKRIIPTSLSNENTLESSNNRPEWACDWMPTWMVTMHPLMQLFVGGLAYIFHLCVLTQHGIAFPFQLIPNENGRFQSIGYDSLAGILSFIGLIWLRQKTKTNPIPAVPNLISEPFYHELPWNLRSPNITSVENNDDQTKLVSRSIRAFTYLLIAYGFTGKFSLLYEDLLFLAAGLGMPLTIPMHRSLTVLFGHLTWVGIGSLILGLELKPFFHRKKTKWYKNSFNTYWLWWVLGGYFVSSWIFNIADFCNQIFLPARIFETTGEGVVSQLINPENNDLLASLVGYIAPCISAPWWEEILYRGFMLPALTLHMTFWPAVFVSGIIFSAHHLSATGFLPLAMLGMTWAALYAKCGNLFVTIAIHGMWNSRVFLGSWLGL